MLNRKLQGILAICCVAGISFGANAWDKYVTVKKAEEKVAPSKTVSPVSIPVSDAKATAGYNKYVTRKTSTPAKPATTPVVNVQQQPVQQPTSEQAYQPEIVAPYQMDAEPLPVPIHEQTRDQAQQQLQKQQAQASYQQQDEWNDASFSNDNSGVSYSKTHSQWFDNDIRPVFYVRGGLIDETQFGDYGATEIAIADIRARLFKVTDFLPGGSLDAWLFADGMYFIDNPGMSALPDALLAAGLDLGLWWRFTNGFSWELRGAPGIYSDPTAPEFSCTGTLNLHYTVSENFCLVLGATYRPEWDMEIFPNVGFIWQPSDLFRLHAALPESRVDLFPRHIFNFFGTLAWDNTTYWLDNDEDLPGTVTFDAIRASVGATITLFDDLELTAEMGTHLQHELKGDVKGEDTIELDKATFIRASIGNRF